MFKWLGLVLVLVSWFGGLYLTRTWRGTRAMSISKHAASSKNATKLFAAMLVVGGTASYLWLVAWFVPYVNLGVEFITLLTITFAAQIITGLIPDSNGWKRKMHRMAAYSMAVLYVPLSLLIVSSHSAGRSARIIGIICLSYMLIAFLFFVILRKAKEHYLIAQSLYIVCFQIIILSAAYLPK